MLPEEIIAHIQSPSIKNLIVDCDAGADGDDQFALAYALRAPDRVRVLAANSAPFNDNAAEMAAAGKLECEKIIAAAGLAGQVPAFTGSSDFITRAGGPVHSPAAENIRRAVLTTQAPVYVVITGCCTNVASALALYPEIRERLVVVWLALDNLEGQHNTGEYNYHNDIEGGRLLFSLAENMVLVCAGRVVAPYRRTNDEIDAMFASGNPLSVWLRRRFREISWAQGLWDLCGEGLLICPAACKMEVHDRPRFGADGEITDFDAARRIVVVNENNAGQIIKDAVRRINGSSTI